MKNKAMRLPGKRFRILSFIPILNCIALIYIGAVNSNIVNAMCGVLYFIVPLILPKSAAFFWIAGIVHYSIANSSVKSQILNPSQSMQSDSYHAKIKVPPKFQQFSDITISGNSERRQTIPGRAPSNATVAVSILYESSKDKFFKDMKQYENLTGAMVPFQPFMSYWPTYESMSKDQQSWYFYWRTEVRNGNYIDTDLSYIFIYIYELLSGVGWKNPEEGYDKLVALWHAYQQRFPKLDTYLYSWTSDFAQLNNVQAKTLLKYNSFKLIPSIKTDLMIEHYSNTIPLKLPFEVIDVLCDYSLVGSKFYKEGHQALMQEAIPRVVALADAKLRKEKKKGILEMFGPSRAEQHEYCLFRSALCPDANKKISVSVKGYSTNQELRDYINELVRYAENSLRIFYGYRGRLRGLTLDDETAKLVDVFLKREYSIVEQPQDKPVKKVAVELDFTNIENLRHESDAVRAALQAEEGTQVNEKELLTDVAEVTAIYEALSHPAKALLDRLQSSSWVLKNDPENQASIVEINRLSEHYIGCNLLSIEGDNIIAEDDYQDELDYIYENPPLLKNSSTSDNDFYMLGLSGVMYEFVNMLVPEQRRALYAVLMHEDPEQELESISEVAMTMPQILIDDINYAAMQTLGDIVIDTQLQVVEEYKTELKKSIA